MPSAVTDVESDWEIFDCPKDPEYSDCKIEIEVYGLDLNMFKLCIHLVNDLSCILQYNSKTHLWKIFNLFPTKLNTSGEQMDKEC
ncbi:unnamed protein product [Adineta steineri]|nr:unnamed protein product [Adineta steineri]CAF1203680.1 unnamed protein product [Adineta steineri]CAF3594546.1 unnamed protein product [Adineta steineri]CAF3716705.1 unnamed protein product [Adineta steineri]CAF4054728.1 unnamed protein product [Adineta steineri]